MMVETGTILDAQACLKYGLIDELSAEEGQALPAAMAHAKKLAEGPSVAVDLARRCVYKAPPARSRSSTTRRSPAPSPPTPPTLPRAKGSSKAESGLQRHRAGATLTPEPQDRLVAASLHLRAPFHAREASRECFRSSGSRPATGRR